MSRTAQLAFFVLKRLLVGVVVIWAIVTVTFALMHSPGAQDPIREILGNHYTSANYATLKHEYGLDISLWSQYLQYVGMAPILSNFGIHIGHGAAIGGLLQGNFGYSFQNIGVPVWDLLSPGVPVTMKLGLYALILSLVFGIPIGLLSALKQNSWIDHVSQSSMMVLYALPTFVLAPIVQILFSIQWHILPESGWGDNWQEMVLPISVYAAGLAGYFAKSFRSFMLEVLQQDYIRTARAKGLKQRIIVVRHAMKNTMIPLISVVGPVMSYLIVGAFIIEAFFRIPGIAFQTVQASQSNDYAMVEATTILLVTVVVVVNMLSDILYTFIDPRVKL